jgi:drug/metabolite transporter (DMT)-like permease
MSDFRNTLRGIVSMVLSALFFILNDTLIKLGSESLPVGEVLLFRSIGATAIVGLIAWQRGVLGRLAECLRPTVLCRSAADGGATVFYMTGLVHMPIANASAIGQAFPLAIAAVGAFLFKERTDWQRWLAIVVGFLGVMLIVRPGSDGFNAWSIMIVLSIFTLIARDVATRFMGGKTDLSLVVLANCVVVTLVCVGMTVVGGWQAPSLGDVPIFVGSAVCMVLGIGFGVDAMLHGAVSVTAPFRYSFMLFALIIGYVVWGDMPDPLTLLGIAVVVGSGLYVVYRERRASRLARPGVDVEASVVTR